MQNLRAASEKEEEMQTLIKKGILSAIEKRHKKTLLFLLSKKEIYGQKNWQMMPIRKESDKRFRTQIVFYNTKQDTFEVLLMSMAVHSAPPKEKAVMSLEK